METTIHNELKSDLYSLEKKVLSGFALAAIALVVIGLFYYRSIVRFRADAKSVSHTHQVLNTLSDLLSDVTTAESALRGYLLTGNEEFQQSYDQAAQRTEQELRSVRELTHDNAQQQMTLNTLEPLVKERLAFMQNRIELRRKEGLAAVQAQGSNGKGRELQASIRRTKKPRCCKNAKNVRRAAAK